MGKTQTRPMAQSYDIMLFLSAGTTKVNCLDFNNGFCNFNPCRFTHARSHCGGTTHGKELASSSLQTLIGVRKAAVHPEVSTPTFVVKKPPTDVEIDNEGSQDGSESNFIGQSQPESNLSLSKPPINMANLRAELCGYDQDKANAIYNGFSFGFRYIILVTDCPRNQKV